MTDTEKMPPVDLTPEQNENRGDRPYWQDLNPDFLAGENHGIQGPHPARTEAHPHSAYDVKGAHDRFYDWNDADLRQVPILPTGSRLEQGATYIDLHASAIHEFSARGDETAGLDNWYAPKDLVPYPLWNRLIGVNHQEDRAKGSDIGIGDGDVAGTNISDRSQQQKQTVEEEKLRAGITGGYGTGGAVGQGEDDGR